jgi:hypothetical protein
MRRSTEFVRGQIAATLVEAAVHWAAEGFPRFSDNEVCFTFELARAFNDVARTRRLVYRARLEQLQYTEAHYSRRSDPSTAGRCDIAVAWGRVDQELHALFEGKKLSASRRSATAYVVDGMARFVDGAYPVADDLGAMLGIIVRGQPSGILATVNQSVTARWSAAENIHAVLIDDHARLLTGRSSHTSVPGGLRLAHVWVRGPGRGRGRCGPSARTELTSQL